MTESVVADFVARFLVDRNAGAEPVHGRVVMSPKRVVLAGDTGKTTIPLTAIQDVGVGHVSEDISDYFDDTVTIAYKRDDRSAMASIETEREKIVQFAAILFKALLSGQPATILHPAAVGGRLTREDPKSSTLRVMDGSVVAEDPEGDVFMELNRDTIISVHRETRPFAGFSRPGLGIRHDHGGTTVRTDLSLPSKRHLSILSRFLQIARNRRIEEVASIDLDTMSLRALLALYASSDVDLENVLDEEPSSDAWIDPLQSNGLVEFDDGGASLTIQGRILLFSRLDEIDDILE